MNIDTLTTKREELQEQFDQRSKDREKCLHEAAAILEDMHRLQGAYKAVTDLIEQASKDTEAEIIEPSVHVEGE